MLELMASSGKIGAERFIVLIQREPFDHIKWRKSPPNSKQFSGRLKTSPLIFIGCADQRKL
jgi:hypothetical protein